MTRTLKIVSIIVFALVILLSPGIGSGPGDDDETSTPPPAAREVDWADGGSFYAYVELRDDIRDAKTFLATVKVYPPEVNLEKWPGVEIKTREAYPEEVNVRTKIQIRGIDVPRRLPTFARPHVFIERERARFDDAVHFVWGLISNSKTPNRRPLILKNPVVGKKDTIIVDCFVIVGGHELDVAAMMVGDGHALYGKDGEYNWGGRLVLRLPR